MRQAHYLFNVIMVLSEYRGLWPCGPQDSLHLPCFTEGETESQSDVLRGYIASAEQSWSLNPGFLILSSILF